MGMKLHTRVAGIPFASPEKMEKSTFLGLFRNMRDSLLSQVQAAISQLSPLLTAGLIGAAIAGAVLGCWGSKFLVFGVRLTGTVLGAALAGFLFLSIFTTWGGHLIQQIQPLLR
jgi:hypothetical protein